MAKATEDLDKLSKEVRQLGDEIANMKAREIKMVHGAERRLLNKIIRDKQYQALFYLEKMENLNLERNKKV